MCFLAIIMKKILRSVSEFWNYLKMMVILATQSSPSLRWMAAFFKISATFQRHAPFFDWKSTHLQLRNVFGQSSRVTCEQSGQYTDWDGLQYLHDLKNPG